MACNSGWLSVRERLGDEGLRGHRWPADRNFERGHVDVTGITQDSRFVKEGYLFVALVGKTFDGRAFIPDALERGAVGVMSSGPPPPGYDRVWLSAKDPRWLVGPMAGRIYDHPDRHMR